MAPNSFVFPEVTLLITHYNRSLSLERLLANLQKRFEFELVTATTNGGLGNNINKGQDAVATPYTLYVQEDFEPTELFPSKLEDALTFLQ